jgi:methionine aminotransferase
MKPQRKHTGSDLTIFSEMTALAIKNNAVNLAQGFPDYEIDGKLKKFLAEATEQNFNQYAPSQGNPLLIENLIQFNLNRKNPIALNTAEITITAGATYAIYTIFATILQPNDEVIVLEPAYDCYVPSIEVNGGKPVFVSLKENFEPDFEAIKNAISEKTKAIIINSPHNPSGKVWKKEDFEKLWNIIKNHEIYVVSDEVYDLLTFDGNEYFGAFHHLELQKRSFSVFSFGKMFHITGWKVGYVLANEDFSAAFRRIHQYLCFSVNSPSQQALAKYLEIFDVKKNSEMLQQTLDFFISETKNLPFEIAEKTQGSYFQVMSFEKIRPEMADKDFAIWLLENFKVATVPVSAFYNDLKNTGKIRFCFAKKEETIKTAVENLKKLL